MVFDTWFIMCSILVILADVLCRARATWKGAIEEFCGECSRPNAWAISRKGGTPPLPLDKESTVCLVEWQSKGTTVRTLVPRYKELRYSRLSAAGIPSTVILLNLHINQRILIIPNPRWASAKERESRERRRRTTIEERRCKTKRDRDNGWNEVDRQSVVERERRI